MPRGVGSMALVHGRAITSEEIERIVSERFTPKGFASLCNAVAWASSSRRCSALPSFTERVNARDGGVDAEWDIELPENESHQSILLGAGWNVFQYKQRSIVAQGRQAVFSNLRGDLSGAVADLCKRARRRPDRYVLFTNIDLTHLTTGQKGQLRNAILDGYDNEAGNVRVEIVGAAELASLLNSHPHLRSA